MNTLLLSKQDAAQLLGISMRTLDHLISKHELPTRRIGRRVLIARSGLESFVNAKTTNENRQPEHGTGFAAP
jgi:excisionase family DNA binding protein